MCSLCFTGLLHSKHSFSGAVSRPAPSEGHPCPSEDLSPCHTAGRAHCWVGTTPTTTADAGCPCSRTVVWYPSSSFFFSIFRSRRRGPVNGDECYFWRTTGCHFGDNCRYKHIPDQKGKDRKPWQPWSQPGDGRPDWKDPHESDQVLKATL